MKGFPCGPVLQVNRGVECFSGLFAAAGVKAAPAAVTIFEKEKPAAVVKKLSGKKETRRARIPYSNSKEQGGQRQRPAKGVCPACRNNKRETGKPCYSFLDFQGE